MIKWYSTIPSHALWMEVFWNLRSVSQVQFLRFLNEISLLFLYLCGGRIKRALLNRMCLCKKTGPKINQYNLNVCRKSHFFWVHALLGWKKVWKHFESEHRWRWRRQHKFFWSLICHALFTTLWHLTSRSFFVHVDGKAGILKKIERKKTKP